MTREISWKGSKIWKNLNACDFQALRQHYNKIRPDSVMEITAWAQEDFLKLVSVNTVPHIICKCRLKLCHAKRKPYMNMIQSCCCLLWAKAHLKWTESGKLFWGQRIFSLKHLCSIPKEKDHPACFLSPASLMVLGLQCPWNW